MTKIRDSDETYRVAVVEPDEQLNGLYKGCLEAEGYEVTSFNTLQQRLEGYDTVFSEYFDPEQGEVHVEVPDETELVYVSSQERPQGIDERHFLKKPVDIDELREAAKALESDKIAREPYTE